MELKHIDIANLAVSTANMRGIRKTPDLTNILPSVRARGILVPLIVRMNGSADSYEIVAGKRRYHSALAIAADSGGIDPLPCAIMEPGDDAAALEASLIENIARLDPDEVTRWESFTRLVREGRSPEDISLTFGLTELQVKRTLALGNLLPRIRTLFRKGAIDAATVRHLTLASKAQQRDWLALLDDESTYCPTGHQLKAWLFGGASIPTGTALFDLADYPGESVESCSSEAAFDEKRRAVLAVLGFDSETPTVTGGCDGDHGVAGLLSRLIELPDPAVLDILAIVMGETLEAASPVIETLGIMVGIDMAKLWQPDEALIDLIRDREVIGAILTDVAGEAVAKANDGATGKIKRQIVRDCLTGGNGRAKVEGWVPRWMAFPPSAYTERGGVGTVARAASLEAQPAVEPQAEPLAEAA